MRLDGIRHGVTRQARRDPRRHDTTGRERLEVVRCNTADMNATSRRGTTQREAARYDTADAAWQIDIRYGLIRPGMAGHGRQRTSATSSA